MSKYASNLNELASKGKLDPVIGRDDEIRRVEPEVENRTGGRVIDDLAAHRIGIAQHAVYIQEKMLL